MAEAGAPNNKTHTIDMTALQHDITCQVCNKIYSYPKTINCLHSFCVSCLRSLSSVNSQNNIAVICPKCSCESEIPGDDFEGYPDAFHINRKIEVYGFLQKVTGRVSALCEKCSTEKNKVSTSYCINCTQFICDFCVTIHRNWSEFRTHKVVPLSNLKNSTGECIPERSVPFTCHTHSKSCTMFCETCQMEICHECIIRAHRDHNYNLAKETAAKHKKEVKSALSEITDIPQQLQLAIDQVGCISQRYAVNTKAVVSETKSKFEALKQQLSKRCHELVQNAQDLETSGQIPLQKQIEQLTIVKQKADDCIDFVSSSCSGEHISEFFKVEKQMKKQVQAVKTEFENIDLMPIEDPESYLFLQPDTEDSIMEAGNVSDGSILYAGTTEQKTFSVKEIITFFIALSSAYYKSRASPIDQFKAEIQSLRDGSICPAKIAISSGGFAKLQCSFSERGRYSMNVYARGKHITGSPYTFYVKPPAQHFQTAVKTIPSLSNPRAIAINSKNQIIVTEETCHSVTVYGRKSRKLLSFGSSGQGESLLNRPLGVAVDKEGNIYIADSKNNSIKKYSPDGNHLATFNGTSSSCGALNQPSSIKINGKGQIFVVDRGNCRVVIVNADFEYQRQFGGPGIGLGKLEDPWDIAFDTYGVCYITDMKQDSINIFSPSGEFRGRIGSHGTQKGKLYRPSGITIDRFCRIFVSEAGNHRVSIFHVCSEFLECFSTGLSMVNPCGIAIDDDGFVYVTCSTSVHIF